MRASKARAGLRAGQARHRRWNAYGKHLPSGPEVGAVCGKTARTDLRGGASVPTATDEGWPLYAARESKNSAMKNQRVLIAGAGIAGPSLAHCLLHYGFEPTLVERAPAFREGGYMIDVWGTGHDVLERYGLLEPAQQRGYVFDRLKFVDARGKEVSGFGGAVFRRGLGRKFFSIPRGDLARTIYHTIDNRVETLYGASIHTFLQHRDGVDVEFFTAEERRFDLLIGADGLHSRVRELAFGPEAQFEKYLGYVAASFIADGYPHRDEGAYVSFARPGRQISRYAMRRDQSAFLLVFAEKNKPGIAAHDAAAQKALLRSKFGDDGWEAPEILKLLDSTKDLYFDAISQIHMPRWADGRVALVGDAAHSPSLLAGAGAAFAMLGAYILAGELHAANGDFGRAFPAYEQRLQPFILRQQNAAASFAGSFTPKTTLGVFLRDCVLTLMNVPVVGVWLARRMFGDRFPLPDYG
jgi:2-polyprenyl-6-methoxyphenol hydroxylase-like FAD-dependent oxidoreductase